MGIICRVRNVDLVNAIFDIECLGYLLDIWIDKYIEDCFNVRIRLILVFNLGEVGMEV